MKIGEKIYKLRQSKRITQEQLADDLGLSRQSISQWESGQVQNIKRANLEQLATRFDVSITDLYDDEVEITLDGTPIRKTSNATSNEPNHISNQVYNIYCIYRKKPNTTIILANGLLLALILGIAIWSTVNSCQTAPNLPFVLVTVFFYVLVVVLLITILLNFFSYQKAKIGYLTPKKLHFDCYDGKIESNFDISLENIASIKTNKIANSGRKRGQVFIQTATRSEPYKFSAIIEDPESLISTFEKFKSLNLTQEK